MERIVGKSIRKISNWKEYNQALVNRGSLTVWIDEGAIKNWLHPGHHGGRGRDFKFSNFAIETALMLKVLFMLPLRSLEGFINSLFQLMKVPLCSPDYSSISRRAQSVEIKYRPPSKGAVTHLVIDATGLKVFGAGEWRQKHYGLEKRRVWRKLHIAVDSSTHAIVSAEVSVASVSDNEVFPTLVNPLRRRVEQISADGAYDTRACYKVAACKGAKVTIPPRKNAAFWEEGHPRNEAVKALHNGVLKQWKVDSGYHRRSLAETAFSRYKQMISERLSLRDYNGQVGEVLAGVKVLNKLTSLGMPERRGSFY